MVNSSHRIQHERTRTHQSPCYTTEIWRNDDPLQQSQPAGTSLIYHTLSNWIFFWSTTRHQLGLAATLDLDQWYALVCCQCVKHDTSLCCRSVWSNYRKMWKIPFSLSDIVTCHTQPCWCISLSDTGPSSHSMMMLVASLLQVVFLFSGVVRMPFQNHQAVHLDLASTESQLHIHSATQNIWSSKPYDQSP